MASLISRACSGNHPSSCIASSGGKICSLNVKLSGPENYSEWVTAMKLFLRMAKVGNLTKDIGFGKVLLSRARDRASPQNLDGIV